MSWGGIDVRKSGTRLLFEASLLDGNGDKITTGDATLRLFELQDDGSLKSYDFDDDTFKATALTTATLALTHQTGNDDTYDTGIWTVVLTTLTGFTVGGVYYAEVTHTDAAPMTQTWKFQYGGQQGELRAEDIADAAITANKLAAAAITAAKIADFAILQSGTEI